MISVEIGSDEPHEYASGISAGDVILNVHGKRSGAVAALVDGVERDFSYELDADCSVENQPLARQSTTASTTISTWTRLAMKNFG